MRNVFFHSILSLLDVSLRKTLAFESEIFAVSDSAFPVLCCQMSPKMLLIIRFVRAFCAPEIDFLRVYSVDVLLQIALTGENLHAWQNRALISYGAGK